MYQFQPCSVISRLDMHRTKGTYVPYDGTYGTLDQGQMLDVQEGQTAESALRDDWPRNVPHHTLEVGLEVILEHMCTGLRP
jgi:hypothetical protein